MSETPQIQAPAADQVEIGAKWEYDPRQLPTVVNQVLIQHAMADAQTGRSNGMYISLGHVNPPVFIGEMSAEQASNIDPLPVVIVGSFYLPMQSVIALRDSLSEALRNGGVEQ
ncbi:hypothetical protein [Arthrobacter sp. B2a2-09]|uniref:hypothetical protein n=1 Tax=Arthrobacter sp. B2a2-09 TaxID=2952822 RepID=UPI0022CD5A48|nr:hypothetical protein [Arthrobacter sp. B2a2-09]